eukprot:gnl/Chilomastix_cuspidata/1740.p1 GENE.gnl/Chilomastix_cuspidata/1740~~gnl/Chilomastix_cuspidata/1740.p1  ORF type:complete len:825 (+),score=299.94 gnl/Chilomastix_cuspidata/1740:4366-6840(+)
MPPLFPILELEEVLSCRDKITCDGKILSIQFHTAKAKIIQGYTWIVAVKTNGDLVVWCKGGRFSKPSIETIRLPKNDYVISAIEISADADFDHKKTPQILLFLKARSFRARLPPKVLIFPLEAAPRPKADSRAPPPPFVELGLQPLGAVLLSGSDVSSVCEVGQGVFMAGTSRGEVAVFAIVASRKGVRLREPRVLAKMSLQMPITSLTPLVPNHTFTPVEPDRRDAAAPPGQLLSPAAAFASGFVAAQTTPPRYCGFSGASGKDVGYKFEGDGMGKVCTLVEGGVAKKLARRAKRRFGGVAVFSKLHTPDQRYELVVRPELTPNGTGSISAQLGKGSIDVVPLGKFSVSLAYSSREVRAEGPGARAADFKTSAASRWLRSAAKLSTERGGLGQVILRVRSMLSDVLQDTNSSVIQELPIPLSRSLDVFQAGDLDPLAMPALVLAEAASRATVGGSYETIFDRLPVFVITSDAIYQIQPREDPRALFQRAAEEVLGAPSHDAFLEAITACTTFGDTFGLDVSREFEELAQKLSESANRVAAERVLALLSRRRQVPSRSFLPLMLQNRFCENKFGDELLIDLRNAILSGEEPEEELRRIAESSEVFFHRIGETLLGGRAARKGVPTHAAAMAARAELRQSRTRKLFEHVDQSRFLDIARSLLDRHHSLLGCLFAAKSVCGDPSVALKLFFGSDGFRRLDGSERHVALRVLLQEWACGLEQGAIAAAVLEGAPTESEEHPKNAWDPSSTSEKPDLTAGNATDPLNRQLTKHLTLLRDTLIAMLIADDPADTVLLERARVSMELLTALTAEYIRESQLRIDEAEALI